MLRQLNLIPSLDLHICYKIPFFNNIRRNRKCLKKVLFKFDKNEESHITKYSNT